MLRSEFFTAEEVETIVRDYRSAGLSGEDVALISFAEKVALDAHKITQEDIDSLRRQGFSDEEILDVALTAAARSFFSKVLDAVGAEPDAKYQGLEKPLREALTVGRKFPQTEK